MGECDHTFLVNWEEVDTTEHGIEMDDGRVMPVVCCILGFNNPHPRCGVGTTPYLEEPINQGTWNDCVEVVYREEEADTGNLHG